MTRSFSIRARLLLPILAIVFAGFAPVALAYEAALP